MNDEDYDRAVQLIRESENISAGRVNEIDSALRSHVIRVLIAVAALIVLIYWVKH